MLEAIDNFKLLSSSIATSGQPDEQERADAGDGEAIGDDHQRQRTTGGDAASLDRFR